MEEKTKCTEKVYPRDRWGSFHPYQCRLPVKVERDGKPYCSKHDPEAVKKREEESRARWDAQMRASDLKVKMHQAGEDGYTLAKSVLETEDLYGDAIRGMAPFGKWNDAVALARKIVEGVEG